VFSKSIVVLALTGGKKQPAAVHAKAAPDTVYKAFLQQYRS
jgi:hypothetical protein